MKDFKKKGLKMLLILGLLMVIVVFSILWCSSILDEIAIAVVVVGSILLAAVLIVLPVSRAEVHVEIVAFQQVEKDIEIARTSNLHPVERAALTKTVIESNIWLAKKKFRNEGMWDIFIPDEVNYLKKLQ